MAWTEEKTIKVKLCREQPEGNDLSVTFGVSETGREEFQKLLNNFMDYCQRNDAVITAESVTDGESGVSCSLTVAIKGSQAKLAREFQKRSGKFKAASIWMT